MFHVRFGLAPVCTTLGEAVSLPKGTEGLVDCAKACDEAMAQMARMADGAAAYRFVFMVWCSGWFDSATTSERAPEKQDSGVPKHG